jgi:hypothetical protein
MDEEAAVMPQDASRSHAILYDQFEDEHRFADWGADELFTRMPRPRVVAGDTQLPRAPRPSHAQRPRALQLVESPVQARATPAGETSVALAERPPASVAPNVVARQPVSLPRPLPIIPSPRPRRTRSVGDWIGARPERIVAWAFVLGLLLVLIAISTADAATA